MALVVSDERLDAATVVDALDNLIAKSLGGVSTTESRIAFRVLDLMRPYAHEKLRYDPFAHDVHRRHGGT